MHLAWSCAHRRFQGNGAPRLSLRLLCCAFKLSEWLSFPLVVAMAVEKGGDLERYLGRIEDAGIREKWKPKAWKLAFPGPAMGLPSLCHLGLPAPDERDHRWCKNVPAMRGFPL